jgi:phosphate transport system protein
MTRELFEKRLREIQDDVLVLGSMAEKAIQRSVEGLWGRDLALSERVVEDDAKINAHRYEIEEKCIQTIATQQPMAADLRVLVAILFISNELERIADHAEGIGRISLMLGDEGPAPALGELPQMAEECQAMLRASLQAFIERDAERARRLCDQDDVVDAIYTRANEELIARAIADAGAVKVTTYLTWTAHNLERIADRVTNICERVIFMVTGQLEEINVSRY